MRVAVKRIAIRLGLDPWYFRRSRHGTGYRNWRHPEEPHPLIERIRRSSLYGHWAIYQYNVRSKSTR